MIATTLAGKPTSRLGLGCGRLDGGASARTSRRIIEQAREAGITHFDLAPSYGMGLAEDMIGDVLAGEAGITIATKVGQGRPPNPGLKLVARNLLRPLLSAAPGLKSRLARQAGAGVARGQFQPQDVERSFTESLRRLKRDRVDAVLLHQPAPGDVTSELTETMQRFVAEGRAAAVGSGTGGGPADLVRFGTVAQYRLDLEHRLDPGGHAAPDGDVILHGALRHYPRPEVLSDDRQAALRELGRDPRDPASWVGTVLTFALARHPHAILLISSNAPERLRAACTAIDWSMVADAGASSGEGDLSAMRRVLGS